MVFEIADEALEQRSQFLLAPADLPEQPMGVRNSNRGHVLDKTDKSFRLRMRREARCFCNEHVHVANAACCAPKGFQELENPKILRCAAGREGVNKRLKLARLGT